MITAHLSAGAHYCGRFAPSPTGPLHKGSMVAALASYLDAKHHGGRWLLRIDDIDPPRSVAGSVEQIIDCLLQHGLTPDDKVDYQSQHSDRYNKALQSLANSGVLFACQCTRATLHPDGYCQADCASQPFDDVHLHPHDHPKANDADSSNPQPSGSQLPAASLRVSVDAGVTLEFEDLVKGPQHIALGATLPNFIIRRRDGLYAYQLAAAIDDAMPGISHVIRGSDLLTSTFRQRYLQSLLQLDPPTYAHLPVLCHTDGSKLSKQTGAPPVDNNQVATNVRNTLSVLGQEPPPDHLTTDDLLPWAIKHWAIERVPK